MSGAAYRPEIDGLRAIAVLTVVLYHFGLTFAGGYVGVDVFFVISGYLITSLIMRDLEIGSFSILEFWERRVRRILPAVAVVVLACLVAGWLMLFPADFMNLGRSVFFQSLFSSNIFFWRTTGYFSSDSAQPLLHTWSLAVEEQFYIIFPFLLIALSRLSKPAIIRCLMGLALISFGLSAIGAYLRPTASFFLLPARAWELLLGAWLAVAPSSDRPLKWGGEFWSWAGLLAILGAAFFYDKNTRFPGLAALPPCLGTAAIIWTEGKSRTTLGKLLSVRPVVFIGLNSYSLYLWHWPVLIFANYWSPRPSSWPGGLALIGGSVLLAVLTWFIVETPIRRRLLFTTRRRIFVFAVTTLLLLMVLGLCIPASDGFRARWPARALQYAAGAADKDFRVELELASAQSGRLTPIGYRGDDRPVDLLVWGDSHGMAVLHVIDALCGKHGVRGMAATHSATIPLLDFPCATRYSMRSETIPYNQAVVAYVRNHSVKNVLLVAAWSGYLPPDSTPFEKERFLHCLSKTVGALRESGARVFIMKDVPKQDFDVPRVLAAAVRFGRDPTKLGLPLNEYRNRTTLVNNLFDRSAGPMFTVLDPTNLLTDQTGLCRAEFDGKALYFDQHHLTTFGAMRLQPMFETMFEGNKSVLEAAIGNSGE